MTFRSLTESLSPVPYRIPITNLLCADSETTDRAGQQPDTRSSSLLSAFSRLDRRQPRRVTNAPLEADHGLTSQVSTKAGARDLIHRILNPQPEQTPYLESRTTMNRLFGAKSTAPKPTLNSAISNVQYSSLPSRLPPPLGRPLHPPHC